MYLTFELINYGSEAGAIILKLAYGYTIEPHEQDPLVDLADRALVQFSAAAVPGAWLVDTIPACWSRQIPNLPMSTDGTCSTISPRVDARGGFQEDSEKVEGDIEGNRRDTYEVRQEADGREAF